MSKHYFPGGNTPMGFFSYFGNIPFGGERTICLKGASGCGKSTFLRRAAAAFEALGCEAEYFRCSNDPASLDGIRVAGAGFCIVDATAPHVQDPGVPVARDALFHMAAFIDPRAVEPYRDELAQLAQEKRRSYARAYGYLAAAWAVHQNNTRIYEQHLDAAKRNAAILGALALFDGIDTPGAGRSRRLFAGAVTPEGFASTLDTLTQGKAVHVLRGEPGMGTDVFLDRVRQAANLRGLDCECLCDPLDPGTVLHLIIPGMNLCFATKNRLWGADLPAPQSEIDFHEFLGRGVREVQEESARNNAMFDTLAGRAVEVLAAQRALHDRVEEIYIAGMDFDALNEACGAMIARLLEQATG